jgi:hypothetical protein
MDLTRLRSPSHLSYPTFATLIVCALGACGQQPAAASRSAPTGAAGTGTTAPAGAAPPVETPGLFRPDMGAGGGSAPVPCDEDNDGYVPGSASPAACSDRLPRLPGDCDDHNPDLYPSAIEACDGIDEDCDGKVDEGLACSVRYDSVTPPPSATSAATEA